MDDIQALWNEIPPQNWWSLHVTPRKHEGKAQGISDQLVCRMLDSSRSFEKSGKSFPKSPRRHYEEMNQPIH